MVSVPQNAAEISSLLHQIDLSDQQASLQGANMTGCTPKIDQTRTEKEYRGAISHTGAFHPIADDFVAPRMPSAADRLGFEVMRCASPRTKASSRLEADMGDGARIDAVRTLDRARCRRSQRRGAQACHVLASFGAAPGDHSREALISFKE